MARKATDKEIALLTADHQANLILLAATWADEVCEFVKGTDNELIGAVETLLENAGAYQKNAANVRKYNEIRKRIFELRLRGYALALNYAMEQSIELAKNEAKWAAALAKAVRERTSKLEELNKKQIEAICKYAFLQGSTIQETFQIKQNEDADRIVAVCKDGMSTGKTIPDIVKDIRGTRDNNYKDGVLEISRSEAETMARTICCAVADEARQEFYIRNADVIQYEKYVATLSGNTCLVCGVYDGTIYKIPDDLDKRPRLPIHPNCRCTYIPITDLDLRFNSSTRPAEAENFWKEAEEAYNKNPKNKRSWSSLSRSTRLKYYYQAQKDYEKRTGNPAFEQVSQNMSFGEWIATKDDRYIRKYFGETRYELYTRGELPLDKFINPETDRLFTIKELKERDIEAFRKAGLSKG